MRRTVLPVLCVGKAVSSRAEALGKLPNLDGNCSGERGAREGKLASMAQVCWNRGHFTSNFLEKNNP